MEAAAAMGQRRVMGEVFFGNGGCWIEARVTPWTRWRGGFGRGYDRGRGRCGERCGGGILGELVLEFFEFLWVDGSV